VHGLIEPFYEAVPREERGFALGHIYADQPVYLPPRQGVAISRVYPRDDRDLDLTIGGRTSEIFNHPPIHSLKLESSEGFLAAKAKRDRPVIVLGGMRGSEPLAGVDRTQLLDAAICVPIYGADQFEEGLRRRIRAYEFENLFYLPADAALRFDEGFARLDHAQPLLRNQLARHRGLKLSLPALEALAEWYVYFVTERIDEDSLILAYRHEERSRLAAGN
jgi:hypothetical protein